ncbi:hypothetical protein M0804_008831 [Polistes exclamans]|nr:hypothetical protein M0804_008831 [Polistes exclamans]
MDSSLHFTSPHLTSPHRTSSHLSSVQFSSVQLTTLYHNSPHLAHHLSTHPTPPHHTPPHPTRVRSFGSVQLCVRFGYIGLVLLVGGPVSTRCYSSSDEGLGDLNRIPQINMSRTWKQFDKNGYCAVYRIQLPTLLIIIIKENKGEKKEKENIPKEMDKVNKDFVNRLWE